MVTVFDDKEPFRRKFVVRMRCAFTPSVRSITRCSNFKVRAAYNSERNKLASALGCSQSRFLHDYYSWDILHGIRLLKVSLNNMEVSLL